MQHRILRRWSEESVELRRKLKDDIVQSDAEFSSRGRGLDGAAAGAAKELHLAALRSEGLFRVKVETKAHRNEQLLWTAAERRGFFEGFDKFFAERARSLASEVEHEWRKRGLPYNEGPAIAQEVRELHARLRLKAEEDVAAAEQDIRRERRTRGMYRIAFASAIITGLGQLVQSAPLVGWYLKGCPEQAASGEVLVQPTTRMSATVVPRVTPTPVASLTVEAHPPATFVASPEVASSPGAPEIGAAGQR